MAKRDVAGFARRYFLSLAASGAVLLAGAPMRAFAADAPLKIGTIGSGHIGSTLGTLWVHAGHPVMFSSRHPEELKGLVDGLGALAHAGTVAEAVAFADVLLLAVPYKAIPEIGKEYGAAIAAKALVLDASNPIPARDGEMASEAREKGAGVTTAELLGGAHVVRGFNAINYMKLREDANRQGGLIGVPLAGDDQNAVALASNLVREIGFEPVVIGPLAMGKYLIPGTPLAGEHTAEELKKIAATLH